MVSRFNKRKQNVLMHFKESDNSLEGVLMGKSKGEYVLRGAKAITTSGTSPLDGEICVPKAQVLFYQKVSAQPA